MVSETSDIWGARKRAGMLRVNVPSVIDFGNSRRVRENARGGKGKRQRKGVAVPFNSEGIRNIIDASDVRTLYVVSSFSYVADNCSIWRLRTFSAA